jgi:hypothetical protein
MIDSGVLRRSEEVELATLMRELRREKVLRVTKHRLLELVGYTNDASGAWALIRDAFDDVGGNPEELYGIRLPYGDVLLTAGQSTALTRW